MTWASMSRALSQRASQKPSRPASKATAMRLIRYPASPLPLAIDAATSAMRSRRPRASLAAGARRQARCLQRANSTGSSRSLRSACRQDRGGTGIGSQIVQLLQRALHRFISATMDAISSPLPIASFLEAFGRRPPNTWHRRSSGRQPKTFPEADLLISRNSRYVM